MSIQSVFEQMERDSWRHDISCEQALSMFKSIGQMRIMYEAHPDVVAGVAYHDGLLARLVSMTTYDELVAYVFDWMKQHDLPHNNSLYIILQIQSRVVSHILWQRCVSIIDELYAQPEDAIRDVLSSPTELGQRRMRSLFRMLKISIRTNLLNFQIIQNQICIRTLHNQHNHLQQDNHNKLSFLIF